MPASATPGRSARVRPRRVPQGTGRSSAEPFGACTMRAVLANLEHSSAVASRNSTASTADKRLSHVVKELERSCVIVRRATLPAAFLLGLVAVAGVGSSALADAALRGSNPADGAVLTDPPGEVTLIFDETLQERFTTVKITASGGVAVQVGKAATAGAKVVQPLPTTLASGRYTVAYRIVSADGHPVSGTTSFRVQQPLPSASGEPTAATAASTSLEPSSAVTAPTVDSRSGPWLWIIAAVVLTAIAGVLIIGRRRGPTSP